MDSHLPWHLSSAVSALSCPAELTHLPSPAPSTHLRCGWSRLSLCHRLRAVSLSPCRLAVHGSRRLGHWERCFCIVDMRAEPQQSRLSPTTAAQHFCTLLTIGPLLSQTISQAKHGLQPPKLKDRNGRWLKPWTMFPPFPPHFPYST